MGLLCRPVALLPLLNSGCLFSCWCVIPGGLMPCVTTLMTPTYPYTAAQGMNVYWINECFAQLCSTKETLPWPLFILLVPSKSLRLLQCYNSAWTSPWRPRLLPQVPGRWNLLWGWVQEEGVNLGPPVQFTHLLVLVLGLLVLALLPKALETFFCLMAQI